jgi:hypothetical protein
MINGEKGEGDGAEIYAHAIVRSEEVKRGLRENFVVIVVWQMVVGCQIMQFLADFKNY